jgi:hypothetical protein
VANNFIKRRGNKMAPEITKYLSKGDSNTKYFKLVANGKDRKTCIFQLEDGNQIIKGDNQLKEYITRYYKGLFGPNECEDVAMDESRTQTYHKFQLRKMKN